MNARTQKIIGGIILLILLASFILITNYYTDIEKQGEQETQLRVKNIILFIGDGMGIGQIAVLKYRSLPNKTNIEKLSNVGLIATYSADSLVTDSAAVATAIATGFKTKNHMVGVLPNGSKVETVLELAESLNKSTGLVTTTRITHATPAAFASHVTSRYDENEIAVQMLESGVDILLGGGRKIMKEHLSLAESLGFKIIFNRTQFLTVGNAIKLLGLFAEDHMSYAIERNTTTEPSLAEMTKVAINILSRNGRGFFLMVEGGRIDHACHENNMTKLIEEMVEFDEAIGVALEYAKTRNDTIIIVTADHETGGLTILNPPTTNATEINYKWTTKEHTANPVPVYIWATQNISNLTFKDNTEIGKFLKELLTEKPKTPPKETITSTLARAISFLPQQFYMQNRDKISFYGFSALMPLSDSNPHI